MREGSKNGNWKGGISSIRHADEILNLTDVGRMEIEGRLTTYIVCSETGCWNWTGLVFKVGGRARLALGKNSHLVSRLIYVLRKGLVGDLCVLHQCDNVLCINPDHLFLGTNADNSADMVKKGRQTYGDRNGEAKLTQKQVDEIRSAVNGRSLYGLRKNLSRRYGVHPETISRIVGRKSWRVVNEGG